MKSVYGGLGNKMDVFLDTNVLVYAYDRSEPQKQRRALEVMEILAHRGLGVISTQILGEFFNTVTRKLKPPLSLEHAQNLVLDFTRIFRVFPVTEAVVLEAVRGVQRYRFSYWDAQIWAVARMHQIPLVFSEDFATGSAIEGVRIVNPFAEDFRVEAWIGEEGR